MAGAATTEDLERVRDVLRTAGIAPGELQVAQHRSNMAVAVLVGASVSELLKSVIAEVGKDAYSNVKTLVTDLLAARNRPDGTVVIKDRNGYQRLELSVQIPDDAYAALSDVDFGAMGEGELGWDADRARWRLLD